MTPKFRRLQLATPDDRPPPTKLFLSENSKTGVSINVSIARTCRPTSACMEYCYGLESRIRMAPALARQVDNYNRFDILGRASETVLRREVFGVAYEVEARQNFLRFFGVGDLQPGSIRFINMMAEEVPDLALWVSTRKFDMAAQLVQRPNLHVMLSLDHSTKAAFRQQAFNLAGDRAPQFYLAWVQLDETPPPAWASVVFAEHHIGKRAEFTDEGKADPRTCPATIANGSDHNDACAECRFCFTAEKRETRERDLRKQVVNKGRPKTVHLPVHR